MKKFLPTSKEDLKTRGWDELDIILVTGDAYVDHPSYGAAMIGRVLEDADFRVGIIAQPDWHSTHDFKKLGQPKLFFGVTAGNLDSMIANYTANKKVRNIDDYSPGGKPGLRPDRATIIYTNRLKEAFKGVPIVVGGMEASMRRLAHYDYWSDKVRRSLLLDAKADILVFGMGERQMLEIAERLKNGEEIGKLNNIYGTVVARRDHSVLDPRGLEGIDPGGLKGYVLIDSFEEVSSNRDAFNKAFKEAYLEADPIRGKTVVQKHADRYIIQYPPALPLTTEEMDRFYSLNYAREWHRDYEKDGGVPGFETVRNSIISSVPRTVIAFWSGIKVMLASGIVGGSNSMTFVTSR